MPDGKTQLTKDKPVRYQCQDGESSCGDTNPKVGKIELYTYMEYDNTTNADGEKITNWGMEQTGKMLPGADNNFSSCSDTQIDDSWFNVECDLDQNWERSDLTGLENAKYQPSSDKTSSVDTSISASTGGVGVSATVSHPRIKRDMTYTSDRYINGDYTFKGYDGEDTDAQLSQVSTWISDRPSDGDKVSPSYQYGKFEGYNCVAAQYDIVQASADAFMWFDYVDFNSV